MDGEALLLLIVGLLVGFGCGYGVRANRSHLRRRRYRMSGSYHIHGDERRTGSGNGPPSAASGGAEPPASRA